MPFHHYEDQIESKVYRTKEKRPYDAAAIASKKSKQNKPTRNANKRNFSEGEI